MTEQGTDTTVQVQ